MINPLSERGKRLLKETPPLVKAHIECAMNPFDPVRNSDGYINFGTAENKVLEAEILEILNQDYKFKASDLHYNGQEGSIEFRQVLARHLSSVVDFELDPQKIAVASGASAVLEMLSQCLLNSGDRIFIPAPFYAGFLYDFEVRFNAEVVSAEVITADGIDFSRLESELRRTKPKVFMLNNPQNPTGYLFSEQDLIRIGTICQDLDIQIVADEIYAQSVHSPNYKFKSALSVLHDFKIPIHWVYGMAKDFGLSGLKVGIFYSTCPEVCQAMRAQCYFHTVSGTVQRNLIHLLTDVSRIESLMDLNRKRLADRFLMVQRFCERSQIGLFPSAGGIFCYIDLSDRLPSATLENEFLFFRGILESTRVNISPSQFFKAERLGHFRLCFAQDLEVLKVGLLRLENYLRIEE